ncbi:hypothetical protein BaRGS_00019100 [Batillaria attramentaria]|uniref:Secreted protein n=1 Tax=Batillaria attramentaria TaxID=370345 RepID=A0ABD0KR04_9CAEN
MQSIHTVTLSLVSVAGTSSAPCRAFTLSHCLLCLLPEHQALHAEHSHCHTVSCVCCWNIKRSMQSIHTVTLSRVSVAGTSSAPCRAFTLSHCLVCLLPEHQALHAEHSHCHTVSCVCCRNIKRSMQSIHTVTLSRVSVAGTSSAPCRAFTLSHCLVCLLPEHQALHAEHSTTC